MSTSSDLNRLLDSWSNPGPSQQRFTDGGEYRVEIPSVESPDAMRLIVEECAKYGVPLHRVSQGSGITVLTDAVLREYVAIGADANVEVCLFVGPRARWDGAAASALVPDGNIFGARHVGLGSLRAAWEDVQRAVDAGLRSLLVSDEGLIRLIGDAKQSGDLPADLVVKASALMGIANAVGARELAQAGATSLNIATDTTIADLSAFRAATDAALDIYIEGMDNLGGFMRYHDIGDIVRIGSPVFLKFGLKNAPNIYPAGGHIADLVVSSASARVQRAVAGMEHLKRSYPEAVASPVDGERAGVPVRA
ncbi:U32 family peptidase [Sphaerisporangium sp. NPDC051011]|uniref:U32 family peptidase n=1 Tax=Sphaerisporangium sp. NPDC051011 TaxID=3155792 RepID=UPI0033FD87E3